MAGQVIGFIGLGRMGGPMAGRLLDAGHTLHLYDTNKKALEPLLARGVTSHNSPMGVASVAPLVLMSLPTPDIVQAVALGEQGLAQGKAVKTVVDLSTTGPRVAGIIAAGLAEKKISWVDAPVSGGVPGAKAGTLSVMVSCPKATYQAVEPILKTFGKLFFTGEKSGLGQSAKLANNLLGAAAIAVSAEAMAMAVKAGLDAQVMLDIINVSSGRNSATLDKFPKSILTGKFDWGFSTGLSYKDVRLCVDEAEALGVPMVIGAAVRQILAITHAKYGPDSDFTEMARLVEEWAGVEIRSKG
jgi:3-hydroxyisobutyrate dehydrogenase-like beta-hydroxyacid dehydrogenase